MAKEKFVYSFKEGNKDMKELLGGKGANLAEMTTLGIPVPAGFTITTETCHLYYESGKKLPQGLSEQIDANIARLEKTMDTKFNDPVNPLLVSVRSGAASSMPGMMDTILNLGINDQVVEALIRKTKNDRFAWDTYRRFIQMFGNVVMNVVATAKSGAKQRKYCNNRDDEKYNVKYVFVFGKIIVSHKKSKSGRLKKR